MRLRGVWAACVGLLACVSAGQALAADRLARLVNVSNGLPADHKPEVRQHSDVPG